MAAANYDRFKTRKEAFDWLQAQGYKISIGKLYQDCEAGVKITVHQDGTVSKWETLEYAKSELTTGTGTGSTSGLASEQLRKVKAEADMKELQFETASRLADKKWMLHEDVLRETACLIGGIQNAFFLTVHKRTSELIRLCRGKQEMLPDVLEFLEEKIVKEAFNTATTVGCELIFQVDEEQVNVEE